LENVVAFGGPLSAQSVRSLPGVAHAHACPMAIGHFL